MDVRRGPNYYPPGGHDWVATADLRRAAEHNQAQLAEKYTHDVMKFRARLFGKLATHAAVKDGNGWAMFDEAPTRGGVAQEGHKETLLLAKCQIDPEDEDGLIKPYIRIITNELVETGEYAFWLTEDVAVHTSGKSFYYLDVVTAIKHDSEGAVMDHDFNSDSHSLLFMVNAENDLIMATNKMGLTPVGVVKCPYKKLLDVMPYGSGQSLEDNIHALGEAKNLLSAVESLHPTHSFNIAN